MKKLIPASAFALLAAVTVVATLTVRHGIGAAQQPVELSTDTNPGANTATTLGPRDGCVSVSHDDTLDVDITVSDVNDLVAWELYLQFDPTVVEVVDSNVDMLLGSNPRSSLIRKSDSFVGRYFMGAADRRLQGESGSGVLARVTLRAMAKGISDVEILYFDFDRDGDDDFGPRLTDSKGNHIGDVTGDGVFDGPTFHAFVAVDESCTDATPPTTLPPSPVPQPGDSSSPGQASGATSSNGDAAGSNGSPDGSAAGSEGHDSGDLAVWAAALGERDAPDLSDAGDDGEAAAGLRSSKSSSGGGLPLWTMAFVGAAILVAAAGTSVYLAARGGPGFWR